MIIPSEERDGSIPVNNEPETNSALGSFGFPESAIERHIADTTRKEYGRTICICGHPISMHHEMSDRTSCNTSQLFCPCLNKQAVLEVADKRCFMYKSEGLGPKHALSKGLYKAKRKNVNTRLIVDEACFRCQEVTPNLIPVGLNRDYRVVFAQAQYNALFCTSCTEEALGRPVSGFLW